MKHLLIGTLLPLLLVGCFPEREGEGQKGMDSDQIVPLEGQWDALFCIGEGSTYTRRSLVFDTNTKELWGRERHYSDSSCVDLLSTTDNIDRMRYSLGSALTTDTGMTAYKLDYYYTSTAIVPDFYTIVSVNSDRLYLGLGDDTDTEAERPTRLDFSEYYIRAD